MRSFAIFLLGFLPIISTFGEPYLSPNDPFIRHEIRLRSDLGELTGLQNTWPLDLGGLYGMSSKQTVHLPHHLLDDRIVEESVSGWSPLRTTLGLSDDRVTARGFGPEPRSSFTSNASVSWMNDRFAGKLSLNAFYGMEKDWKGRNDEGFALDGSYIATRLGNWSASFGQVERWWGPGWDGSLILSTNARPIPAISIDRRVPEPFDTKWLSWIGPWSFHSFIGQVEDEKDSAIDYPNHYLWGMRGEVRPTLIDGLEIGFFRILQLGGDGRTNSLKMWIDGFLSQDNETGSEQPGNQLAGIDLRWKVLDLPVALYGQVAGEDEDNFFPNSLLFQYGIEGWRFFGDTTFRIFAEYADLTSYWWTGDPRTRNITYGHHIYGEGYRFRGRPIGHWADQDSQILSMGGLLQRKDGIGWGATLRTGELNAGPLRNVPPHQEGTGASSVSNGVTTDYFSIDISNARQYSQYGLSVYTSLGWESLQPQGSKKDDGLSGFLSMTRTF
ncbi:MAG: capsule assembly Wzi family protein [Opitutales bacterium]|nr:capsule assembly Wzi family protein [Opitutales bacterium]